MADISTDVLIIGTGPAGSASAALLSTYGVDNMVINRYRWLANTPRAHITNQRTMEVLRDLGREVEDEAYLFAAEQDLMGENVFCTSLAGEEIGRVKSWGKHPLSRAEPSKLVPIRPAGSLSSGVATVKFGELRPASGSCRRVPAAAARST